MCYPARPYRRRPPKRALPTRSCASVFQRPLSPLRLRSATARGARGYAPPLRSGATLLRVTATLPRGSATRRRGTATPLRVGATLLRVTATLLRVGATPLRVTATLPRVGATLLRVIATRCALALRLLRVTATLPRDRATLLRESATLLRIIATLLKPVLHLSLSASSADQPGQAIASANPGNAAVNSSMCALAMPSSSRSSTPLTVVSRCSARYSSMSM